MNNLFEDRQHGAWEAIFSLSSDEELDHEATSDQDFKVQLPNFEGPLDLLLHLIKRDELNIYDISIAKICESYFLFLQAMRNLNVNLASEYMVMAATLIHIKSMMLLPEPQVEEREDPRVPLVQKLLQYEMFKKIATRLSRRPWLGRDYFARLTVAADVVSSSIFKEIAPLEPIEPFALMVSYRAAYQRSKQRPLLIQADHLSIKDRILQMSPHINTKKMVAFEDVLPASPKVQMIILTFLAILELARLKYIEILQSENFGPIFLNVLSPIENLESSFLDIP